MKALPTPAELIRAPATSGLSVLAIAATAAHLNRSDLSYLHMNFRAWSGEPWRLLTSIFPHVDGVHLAYNLYGLLALGHVVERVFGSIQTAALYCFVAVGSGLAEYAVFHGGVGLSGVVYSLVGLLWVLSKRDERFRDAVDAQTVRVFVIWFFVCIALTITKILPVANVAHGMGAIQGVLLGCSLAGTQWTKVCVAALAGLMCVTIAASSFARRYVNLGDAAFEFAAAAQLESGEERHENAIALYKRAIGVDANQWHLWFNLGFEYQTTERDVEALDAYRRSAALSPPDDAVRAHLAPAFVALGARQYLAGDAEAARRLYREALDLYDREAAAWFNLGVAEHKLGRLVEATKAYEKAVSLEPQTEAFREAWETLRNHVK